MGKKPPDKAGDARDMGSIPRSGRCSGGENKEGSHQEQPSPVVFLESPTDRGAWRATVHGGSQRVRRVSTITSAINSKQY